jgi:lipid A 4'-phosphatase
MKMSDLDSVEECRFRRAMLIGALAAGAVLGTLFLSNPHLDLDFSAAIREVCGGDKRHSGWCHENGIMIVPRYAAIVLSAGFALAAFYVLVRTMLRTSELLGRDQAKSLVLLATFAIGPGVLVNVVLKDNWGRARPREVVEFGGKRQFTPPLVPSRQCVDNCSFVSGEAASVFAPFFAGALLVPQFRVALTAGGILAGSAAGLVRISTGGHFLSDVLFAGVLMAITAALVCILFARQQARFRVPINLKPLLQLASALAVPTENFTIKARGHQ